MEELKRIKLFAKCSDEALERLLNQPCRRQEYLAGRRMFNPGDPCRALMVLVEGQAESRMMGEEGHENPCGGHPLLLHYLFVKCI